MDKATSTDFYALLLDFLLQGYGKNNHRDAPEATKREVENLEHLILSLEKK